MRRRLNSFFDFLEEINHRIPVVHHFLVNLALLGLLILGIYALFAKHP